MGADLRDLGGLDSTRLGRQFGWLPKVLFQYQETCFVWSFHSISFKTLQCSAKLNFLVLVGMTRNYLCSGHNGVEDNWELKKLVSMGVQSTISTTAFGDQSCGVLFV